MRIIFESIFGSKLYGTNTPESDVDYRGVFVRDIDEHLGIKDLLSEEDLSVDAPLKKDKIDRKIKSVKQFLLEARNGQTMELELLFAPESCIITSSEAWEILKSQRNNFISKTTIFPFISFAKGQVESSVLKAENLILIRKIIEKIEQYKPGSRFFQIVNDNPELFTQLSLKDKAPAVIIGNKIFITNQASKDVRKKLKGIEENYGSRTVNAVKDGKDFRSIYHAYRVLFQTEDIIKTQTLSFPLPKEKRDFLIEVKSGNYQGDVVVDLYKKIDEINRLSVDHLPDQVGLDYLNDLCLRVQKKALGI